MQQQQDAKVRGKTFPSITSKPYTQHLPCCGSASSAKHACQRLLPCHVATWACARNARPILIWKTRLGSRALCAEPRSRARSPSTAAPLARRVRPPSSLRLGVAKSSPESPTQWQCRAGTSLTASTALSSIIVSPKLAASWAATRVRRALCNSSAVPADRASVFALTSRGHFVLCKSLMPASRVSSLRIGPACRYLGNLQIFGQRTWLIVSVWFVGVEGCVMKRSFTWALYFR